MGESDSKKLIVSYQEKTPFSSVYDDFYFSKLEGVDESVYVYLEGTQVRDAIRGGVTSITVGEIGFGFGINFLLTLKEFNEHSKGNQKLHYISAEKYPVSVQDLKKLYQNYPGLLSYGELLMADYPLLTPGVHRLFFFEGRVTLDLLIGDALSLFKELDFKAQHWYWDGFAPAKNPDAFSAELFQQIARLSSLHARGASYTAAGWVRRTIEENGFGVAKRAGFGTKRECIVATLEKPPETQDRNRRTPWFCHDKLPRLKAGQTIAVIGAGLGGTAIARTLAEHGFSVTVYDGNGVSTRASSNTVGLFSIQLSKVPNPTSRFSQAALAFFIREIKKLKVPHRLGIFKTEDHAFESLQSSDYPDSFYEKKGDSVLLPECGFVNPVTLCELRLKHPLIRFIQKSVSKIISENGQFKLEVEPSADTPFYDHLIYAVGADYVLGESKFKHPLFDRLGVRAVRGQTLLVKPNEVSKQMQNVLMKEGYASPLASEITGHELHILGATYQVKNFAPDQVELDTQKLILEAKEKWIEFQNLSEKDVVSTKVGFRLSTPDKLPLIGPLCDQAFLERHYALALKGALLSGLPPLEIPASEWLMTGFSSRGITFSSLGAEILTSMMLGLPLPIEASVYEHLHPVRFYVRNLKKSGVN